MTICVLFFILTDSNTLKPTVQLFQAGINAWNLKHIPK